MRNRLRSGGNADLSYAVGRSEYAIESGNASVIKFPPPDVLRQTASGMKLATADNSALVRNAPILSPSPAPAVAGLALPGSDVFEHIAARIDERMQKAMRVNDEMRYPDTLTTIPLNIGTADELVLERATNRRVYLFVINTHPTQRLYVTFGQAATVLNGVPIAPALGSFEWLFTVPQADVHLIANGAATSGVLLYAELPAPR